MRVLQVTAISLLCFLLAAFVQPTHLNASQKQRLVVQSKIKAGTSTQSTSKTRTARAAKPVIKAKTAKKRQPAVVSSKKTPAAKAAQQRTNIKAAAKHKQPIKRTATVAAKPQQSKKQSAANTRVTRVRPGAHQKIPSMAALASSTLPAPCDTIFNPIEAPLKLTSRSYMVMDAVSGGTLLAKNPDAPRQPASTIKVLTGMIALKSLGNNDVVQVSRKAAGMPSSKVHLQPAKSYRACDLIDSVLLASANDASVALAERIAGNENRFAQLMTYNAQRWGAKNTVCRTASGLTAEGQYSTARDLAQIFRVAMQDREFAKRMRERSVNTKFGKKLVNHNKALWRLDGAMGGKTGYTNAARQTYVGQFTRQGHTIVVAIMGSETMWADLEKLVDYGFQRKKQEMARLSSQNRLR